MIVPSWSHWLVPFAWRCHRWHSAISAERYFDLRNAENEHGNLLPVVLRRVAANITDVSSRCWVEKYLRPTLGAIQDHLEDRAQVMTFACLESPFKENFDIWFCSLGLDFCSLQEFESAKMIYGTDWVIRNIRQRLQELKHNLGTHT